MEILYSLLSCTPSEKGCFLKRKNLIPKGSTFFPFRANFFSDSVKTILTELLLQ